MGRQRTDQQHSLEDALACLSVLAGELRVLDAQARFSRNLSRRAIVNGLARASRASTLARVYLSQTWDGMERMWHEQA